MIKFVKMQGAGNDFIVVSTSDTSRDWSKLAVDICDRHYGIGSDGLLLLLPSAIADFRMRVFNTDGSEAEACGNGIRCLIKCFADGGLANTRAREISVETIAGVRQARIYQTTAQEAKIQVSMGIPRFGKKDIPVTPEPKADILDVKSMINYPVTVGGQKLRLNLVSMGNPHAVHFTQQPVADFPLFQLGPKVEQHRIFPKKVNFEVARVLDRQQIAARVWEKGVGETLACGSGACAVMVAARLHGYIDNKVAIKLPGGILEVEWDGAGEVFLSGPAETVFSGEWPD